MSEAQEAVAILFADICGSTALFEETGNIEALSLIGECLDSLAAIAGRSGGRIIRSKGDDLLCTFSDPRAALHAATDMIQAQHGSEVPIHVGIHFGDVINARGDIFGDAVNVAARMLALAKTGEILASEDFAVTLPEEDLSAMRLLERRNVKGKSEAMDIYSVITADTEPTQFYRDNVGHATRPAPGEEVSFPRAMLSLSIRGHTLTRGEDDDELVIGRSEACDLVIAEACVSREHASILVRRGKVVLTDTSSTGTYVVGQSDRPLFVRRESLHLIGAGVLSLGRTPKADNPNLIEYKQTIEG